MFKNLDTEQKRFGLTDSKVAKMLVISRKTYEKKKMVCLIDPKL